jgi:hypothetical protein
MIKYVNHLSLALISKTNTVVFYLFYGIMGIERDSWHPWSGKRLSQNLINLKGAFQAIGWLFSIATF